MADFRADHEIVTKFLLSTCRLRQRLNRNAVLAFFPCAVTAGVHVSSDNEDTDCIPVITGSVAEFYIEPMLSCVGDEDMMFHRSDEIAIPAGTAPPTQLPDEFDSHVMVLEIVDSEYPGYVYLVSSCLLTECIGDGKYHVVERQHQPMCAGYINGNNKRGPATVLVWLSIPLYGRLPGSPYSTDDVYCYRCLSWPTQAADWPTRHRNYTAG